MKYGISSCSAATRGRGYDSRDDCSGKRSLRAFTLAIIVSGAAVAAQGAHAFTVTTIHNFLDPAYPNDGSNPLGGLEVRNNRLWGTACSSGLYGQGIVYDFNINNPSNYSVRSFGPGEGSCPAASLHRTGGILYGSTEFGGSGNGTLFGISPNGFVPLYSFAGNPDGRGPLGELLPHGGYFWGTASEGGASNAGTIFRTDTTGNNYTQVYTFSLPDHFPAAGLTPKNGYLYGVTDGVTGVSGSTAFKMLASPPYTETTLYQFDPALEGFWARSRLVKVGTGAATVFYGTLYGGGPTSSGSIFKMTPGGNVSIVHIFQNNPHGGLPTGDLAYVNGKLYGTTQAGGTGFGTVYEFDPMTSTETTIYMFDGTTGGRGPYSGLRELPAGSGKMYGTTTGGGQHDGGTIFVVQ